MTIDAAWQCETDDIVGSLEVGKCADFVVLDSNPLAVDPQEIIKINVLDAMWDICLIIRLINVSISIILLLMVIFRIFRWTIIRLFRFIRFIWIFWIIRYS